MSCVAKKAEEFAKKTISGRPLDLNDPFDFFVYSQQEIIFRSLLNLGHPYIAIHGMCFEVIAVIYRINGIGSWNVGEDDLLVTIQDSMINKNNLLIDRSKEEVDHDHFFLMLCCALFCYDRAVSRAKKKRIAESSNWLESALKQDFYIPLIAVKKSKVISERAKRAVRIKLAKDPIQKAKIEIERDYQLVKSRFKRRGYTAEFIREMHAKYPVIIDSDTIARLVSKLKASNDLLPFSQLNTPSA